MIERLKSLTNVFRYINKHPLAGRHKVLAYSHFIRWQLSQFINPHEKIVPFVSPTCLSVSKGMTGATGNIYLGLHDFYEMGFLIHFLSEGDLFADIGANIGSYSILASGVSNANTIAFEPSIETFAQLQKNIALNKIETSVKAYNLAVGSKAGSILFTTALDTVNHVMPDYETYKNKNSIEVNVDTLDNIVDAHRVPVMIKIDVEGFETEVINGMKKTLTDNNLKAIIIELNGSGLRYGFDEKEIHNKLVVHNFKPCLYDPFNRSFAPAGDYGQYNTLYIRDPEFVAERVARAKKVTIFNERF